MKTRIEFTHDPEWNARHKEAVDKLNDIIIQAVKGLYNKGMSISDILIAVPVDGLDEFDIWAMLESPGVMFDERCRITKENIFVGMYGQLVSGPGTIDWIGADYFEVRYIDGSLYRYDLDALDRYICLLPHCYFNQNTWYHRG